MRKPESLPQTRGENLPKQYTQSKNLKINASEIKQVDFKLSPRQQLHSGNIPGKSYLTKSPNQILNDINNRNFQFVKLNHRGMPIVKFNYPIGNVVQHGTGINLGSTYYGTVHINKAGGIHIVPWLPK
ncbi:MAG: polymorphic toxin type 50 domain-containing protein [Carboxylicivirga sp.]|jgi:hypothetical protein|nr:polymorphic toxin type 50 domain-containing protein [Carboxylicivirga sp.]